MKGRVGGGVRMEKEVGGWGGYPYSLVRLGSKAGSHNVTVVLQTPRPQQTRLMATVSSPDRKRKKGRRTELGVKVTEGGGWTLTEKEEKDEERSIEKKRKG